MYVKSLVTSLFITFSSFYSFSGYGKISKADLRVSFPALPKQIDNLNWRSLDRWYVINQVFDTLIIFDSHYRINSKIATAWKISPDRLKYQFTIDPGAKFSNGRSITAQDAAFSLKRYLLTQNDSNLLKKRIVGALELKRIEQNITGIRAIEKNKVSILELNFSKPTENLWSFLSMPNSGAIVARESVNLSTLKMKAQNLVSSGPYRIKELTTDSIKLIKNSFYKNFQSQSPSSITFFRHENHTQATSWFNEKKTNLFLYLDPFQKDQLDKKIIGQKISFPYHRLGFLYLNKKLSSSTKKIRSVFNKKCLSRHTIPTLSWSNSFFPPGSPGYAPLDSKCPPLSNPPKSSKQTMEIILEKGINTTEMRDIINHRLSTIGIRAKFIFLNKRELVKRVSTNRFEAVMTSIGFPMEDHEFAIYLYFIEHPAYLKIKKTSQIIEDFSTITRTASFEKRTALLKKMGNLLLSSSELIPLFHTGTRYVLGKSLIIPNDRYFKYDRAFSVFRLRSTTQSEDQD